MRPALLVLLAACSSSPSPAPVSAMDGSKDVHHASPAPSEATSRETGDLEELVLGTVDGSETRLGEHRAPVTVVAMWASFCAPCLRELHLVEALHRAYQDHEAVRVLLVSIDDFDGESRSNVGRIIREKALTLPAFIDHRRALMERLAPRDEKGQAHYTVPMVVVIDARSRLRRILELADGMGEAAFVARVADQVDAALRGEPPPPEQPYRPSLGTAITRRSIKLTVSRLGEHQIAHYVKALRLDLAKKYPDLHDHQLDALMAEIEQKLHVGGTFEIAIPPGHAGPH